MERIKSRVKIVTLQQCSDPCSAAESPNTKHLISQPFLIRLSWNFVCLLSRWKVSSLESKSWPYSTSVFHAALQNLQTLNNLYISHFLTLFHIGSKTLDSSWEGGRITPRKRKRRILAVSYDLKYWGWLVISHLGLPNQEAYGFRPPTHPPPTPGAPKDHPSSTKIARCRYPHGGGAESASIRKQVILAGFMGFESWDGLWSLTWEWTRSGFMV